MVLEGQGSFIFVGHIVGNGVGANPVCAALKFDVILDEDAVLNDGESCLSIDLFVLECGAVENDVVGLPLAGFSTCVDKGDVSAIESGALAIGVGAVVV